MPGNICKILRDKGLSCGDWAGRLKLFADDPGDEVECTQGDEVRQQ